VPTDGTLETFLTMFTGTRQVSTEERSKLAKEFGGF